MELPDQNGLSSQFSSLLLRRLLETRTIIHNGDLTPAAARQITEQLTVLQAESEESIDVVMMSVPGGSFEAALSVYDLMRSMAAPITVLGSGHIVGPGIVTFIGAPAGRRFALPHARFRLAEPRHGSMSTSPDDFQRDAQIVSDLRNRVRSLLAEETGQSEEQIQADLADQKALDADSAVEYGLAGRVVERRDEIS